MNVDIVRAWKDEGYRKSLTPGELASLPPNPAGGAELSVDELATMVGGMKIADYTDNVTYWSCHCLDRTVSKK